MTKIVRLIGDVHGKYKQYRELLRESPYPTIQVGDMGVGFRRWPHGDYQTNPPHAVMVEGNHRFIRGNHDNPNVCRTHTQWISDGSVEGQTMFIGGALSIDKAYRIEDYSWWPDEELSSKELEKMIDFYNAVNPLVMVTHECPESIAHVIADHSNIKLQPQFASRTRQAFESMLYFHKPQLWIFGHWHVPLDYSFLGTRFICLPELAYADVDLEIGELIGEVPSRLE